MFFVDIPTAAERRQIIRIMNKRYASDIPAEYAEKLDGWTGAEIEQLAKDCLFDGLGQAQNGIVPLSKTMKEEISALQNWATTRARKANITDKSNIKPARRIRSHVAHQQN